MDKQIVATGARDLLPLDVVQKRWIEQHLQTTFQQWGYHCIITPMLESLETLTAGGMVKPESVIQIRSGDYKSSGLRPEMTASIARAYASRMEGESTPQRLFYNGSVFRNGPGQKEAYQSGVEMLGAAGLVSDGEILLLLLDCLQQLELPHWQIVLGDASFTSSLLQSFSHKFRAPIRSCLVALDRVKLEQLDIPLETKHQALQLMDLRGNPADVFARCHALPWIANLSHKIDYLKSLVKLWESSAPADRLVLDLSLIQDFDYYTGIVFEVASDNAVIAQGGRYDQLLGVYHPQGTSYPSVGFCWNLEALHKALLPLLPTRPLCAHCLVVPTSEHVVSQAFAYAATLRRDTMPQRVEMCLAPEPYETIVTRARSEGIQRIAWIQADGSITDELLNPSN